MRFSLKTLMALILFCALLSSLAITVRRLAMVQRQEDTVRVETARARSVIESIKRNWQRQRAENSDLDLHIQQRQALLKRIRNIFDSQVAQESQIDPKRDHISIRSIPLIATGAACEEKYLIHVPEGVSAFISVSFLVDDEPTSASADFVITEVTSVALRAGVNQVDFTFTRQTQPPRVTLAVNDTRLEFPSTNANLEGSQASRYLFHHQQDYPVGSDLPTLLTLKPRPGKTEVQLRLTHGEVEDE